MKYSLLIKNQLLDVNLRCFYLRIGGHDGIKLGRKRYLGLPWGILPSKKVIAWKSGNRLLLCGVDGFPVTSRKRVRFLSFHCETERVTWWGKLMHEY